jgi:glycogen operon protein
MLNAWVQPLSYSLPSLLHPFVWHRVVDTGKPSPNDIVEETAADVYEETNYTIDPRSTVVLISRPT